MSNFIDDDVILDFTLPRDLQRLADICEKADRENNYPVYQPYADTLTEVNGKEACVQGHITRKQWEQLQMRYRQ